MTIVTKFACSGLCGAFLIGAATSALAANDPIVAAPSVAAAAQSTTVAPATVKPKSEDKVICRTEVATGSRLGGARTCMKKSDWDAQSQAARHQRDFAPPAGATGNIGGMGSSH
jgi:hypothetical protein